MPALEGRQRRSSSDAGCAEFRSARNVEAGPPSTSGEPDAGAAPPEAHTRPSSWARRWPRSTRSVHGGTRSGREVAARGDRRGARARAAPRDAPPPVRGSCSWHFVSGLQLLSPVLPPSAVRPLRPDPRAPNAPRRAPGLPRPHQRGRRTTMEPAPTEPTAPPRRPRDGQLFALLVPSSASGGGRRKSWDARCGKDTPAWIIYGTAWDAQCHSRPRPGPSAPRRRAFCAGFEFPASITNILNKWKVHRARAARPQGGKAGRRPPPHHAGHGADLCSDPLSHAIMYLWLQAPATRRAGGRWSGPRFNRRPLPLPPPTHSPPPPPHALPTHWDALVPMSPWASRRRHRHPPLRAPQVNPHVEADTTPSTPSRATLILVSAPLRTKNGLSLGAGRRRKLIWDEKFTRRPPRAGRQDPMEKGLPQGDGGGELFWVPGLGLQADWASALLRGAAPGSRARCSWRRSNCTGSGGSSRVCSGPGGKKGIRERATKIFAVEATARDGQCRRGPKMCLSSGTARRPRPSRQGPRLHGQAADGLAFRQGRRFFSPWTAPKSPSRPCRRHRTGVAGSTSSTRGRQGGHVDQPLPCVAWRRAAPFIDSTDDWVIM